MRKKLMAGPYLLWMLVFTIVPLLFVFYYGLTSSDGTFTFSNITAIFEKIHERDIDGAIDYIFTIRK